MVVVKVQKYHDQKVDLDENKKKGKIRRLKKIRIGLHFVLCYALVRSAAVSVN